MAGLSFTCGRWQVSVCHTDSHGIRRRRKRKFKTEDEARAYLEMEGLVVGAPRGRRRRSAEQVIEHIAQNSALTDDGCMVWLAPLTAEGYGRLTWRPAAGEKSISGAHRLSVHLLVAPVPADKVIDHLCRNRACVRPDHLDVVSQRENVMRSPLALGALNAAKTHCPQGHPYSAENTYVYTLKSRRLTQRICKTCTAAYQRKYHAAKKTARAEMSTT